MKISTKFGGPISASYQVICKGVRKTPQKRKKHEIPCQSDIPTIEDYFIDCQCKIEISSEY